MSKLGCINGSSFIEPLFVDDDILKASENVNRMPVFLDHVEVSKGEGDFLSEKAKRWCEHRRQQALEKARGALMS